MRPRAISIHSPALSFAPLMVAALYCCTLYAAPFNDDKTNIEKKLTWLEDYNQARQTASRSNKPVWLQFTGPWCPNCHKMDRETFKNPGVIDQINTQFIAAKISCEENLDLALSFGFTQLPSTVLISPDGRILAKHEGFADPEMVKKLTLSAGFTGDAPKPEPEKQTLLADAKLAPPASADLVTRPEVKDRQPVEVALIEPGTKPAHDEPPPTAPPADDARDLNPEEAAKADAAQEIVRAKASDMPLEPLGHYCPVTLLEKAVLMEVGTTHTATYAARRYYFADAQARKRFAENPERYVPARGGECLVTLVEEKREVAGSKEFPVVYDGRIFLCASQTEREHFLQSPVAYASEDVRHPGVCSHCKEPINAKTGDRSRFQIRFGGSRYLFPDKAHMEAFLLSPLKYLR